MVAAMSAVLAPAGVPQGGDEDRVNILVVEPRYADPLSLVHYRKVLVTKAAMDTLKSGAAAGQLRIEGQDRLEGKRRRRLLFHHHVQQLAARDRPGPARRTRRRRSSPVTQSAHTSVPSYGRLRSGANSRFQINTLRMK